MKGEKKVRNWKEQKEGRQENILSCRDWSTDEESSQYLHITSLPRNFLAVSEVRIAIWTVTRLSACAGLWLSDWYQYRLFRTRVYVKSAWAKYPVNFCSKEEKLWGKEKTMIDGADTQIASLSPSDETSIPL